MDKKVVLISTFCDTKEKIDVLFNNIKLIKSLGLDVICISPFALNSELMNSCDYFLITKDNPVLNWPIKAIGIWNRVFIDGKSRVLSVAFPDYGYAGLNQVKQLSELALNMDYTQFYHMIYDTKIDNIVKESFNLNLTNSIYGSKRDGIEWKVGLHLMVFDKENLKKFISEINLNSYLNNKTYDAFEWLHNTVKKLNFVIEDNYIEDYITYKSEYNFFNISPIEETKIFINKDTESGLNVKLYFYDVLKNNIKIFVGEDLIADCVINDQEYDLGLTPFENKEVTISYDNKNHNITNIINKLKHSNLKYE